MTKEEIKEILTLLQTYYPQSFKDQTEESANTLANLWFKAMEYEEGNFVKKAVWEIIKNERRQFAPNIADVRYKMLEIEDIAAKRGLLTVDDAWAKARAFWCSIGSDNPYDIEDDWKKLPLEIRKIYRTNDMVHWALANSSEIDRFEKPRFYQRYKEIAEETKMNLLKAPSITKLAIETNNAIAMKNQDVKQIAGGDAK